MNAYVIGEIEVTDPAVYDDYRKQVLATVTKYGGRFQARGGKAEALEGAAPKRIVGLDSYGLTVVEQVRPSKRR